MSQVESGNARQLEPIAGHDRRNAVEINRPVGVTNISQLDRMSQYLQCVYMRCRPWLVVPWTQSN